MTEEFKQQVQEYMQLDNDIKEATKALSTLKKRKTQLSLNINGYMKSNEIDELKLNDCKLKSYVSVSTAPLNKAWILERLKIICKGNDEQAQEMCDFICDPQYRDKKKKESIKRLKLNKKEMKKN